MNFFVAELVGTMFLIILGDGVVANVLLTRSKAENAGWMVIATGWGLAVAVGVYIAGWASGAHINPAVTIGFLAIGKIKLQMALVYIAGQMTGAFLGAIIVWLHFLPHWSQTEDSEKKLAVFCTDPAIANSGANLVSEIIGTMVLLVGVLGITATHNNLSSGLAPLLVGFLVWSIGLSLGGTTGYAINPARDLGPRIAHALLPIAGKGKSNWGYAWIPVVGPIIGGVAGALFFRFIITLMQQTP